MTRLVRCSGCRILVSPGPRCSRCQRAWEKAYDAGRPAHHSLYRRAAWKALSIEVRKAESRCRWCLRPLPFPQRVADHIVPLEAAPELALDRDNLAVACKGCNTRRGRNWRLPDPEQLKGAVA